MGSWRRSGVSNIQPERSTNNGTPERAKLSYRLPAHQAPGPWTGPALTTLEDVWMTTTRRMAAARSTSGPTRRESPAGGCSGSLWDMGSRKPAQYRVYGGASRNVARPAIV